MCPLPRCSNRPNTLPSTLTRGSAGVLFRAAAGADLSEALLLHLYPQDPASLPDANTPFHGLSFPGHPSSSNESSSSPVSRSCHILLGQFKHEVRDGKVHYTNLWEKWIAPRAVLTAAASLVVRSPHDAVPLTRVRKPRSPAKAADRARDHSGKSPGRGVPRNFGDRC